MERAIRPAPRPSRRRRELVALGTTVLTVLLIATMVVAAVRGGDVSDAYRFLYSGMVVMLLATGSWIAWRWAWRARPQVLPAEDTDAPLRRHDGLSGQDEPPIRW